MQKLNIKTDSMYISPEDFENIKNVLEKSQMSIFNSEIVEEFEKNLEIFLGTNKEEIKAVMLPNCTSAIFIALQLLNLQEGDEIIVPNLTHSSSIYPILYSYKCKIKICDFYKDAYDLDLSHLESLITEKTKGIIVCYLHGTPFNIEAVCKLSNKYGIKVIEDAAQGLGVFISNKMAGTFGDYGCFSFGENKLLRMGEGGALIYRKESERNIINRYRHVGEIWKSSGVSTVAGNTTYGDLLKEGIDYKGMGLNFRCNPLNVAVGLEPLKNLDKIINVRREKLSMYYKFLQKESGIKLMNNSINESSPLSAWFLIDPKYYDINKVIIKCIELGIPVGKFKYPTINKIEAFQDYILNSKEEFLNSEEIRKNSLFLPLYENITFSDIISICENFKKILKEYSTLKIEESILNKPIEYFDGFFMK